jgi:metal-responsive CopG/Arc/MetJ family transcriptional regulator
MQTKMVRISVPIQQSIAERLDAIAEEQCLSTAAVVRKLVDIGLSELKSSSRRVSEMTEEQLRAIVRQEVSEAVGITRMYPNTQE